MPEPARTLTDTPPHSYSTTEVATLLGVTRQTVHRWVATGRLAGFNIGGPGRARIRVTKRVVEAFIDSNPVATGDLAPSSAGVGV